MTDIDGFVLGVDLGTSHTVAMLRHPDGRTRPLLFDGQPLLPSAVYLDTTGRLHVGNDALRLGHAEPGRLEPHPKRRVDEATVLLGGVGVPVADLFAALLGVVAREAVATAGLLPPAVLTYPAAWGAPRRAVLTDALAKAGWPADSRLVPEPVAAARYFADVLRRPIPVGASLAVFDFGGGTLDVAVVRHEGAGPGRFAVTASGGADDLGGLDLDAALVDHLGKTLAGAEPEAWRRLTEPVTLAEWRARRQFWEDVRGAKEMLSRSSFAPVPVPGVEHAVHLTRDELEAAADPLVRRGVTEAAAVIAAAGLQPTELAGLFLVGGSSRVPLVARLLHGELGVAPTVLEQPELPVAEGALLATEGAVFSGGATAGATAGAAAGPPRFASGVATTATPTPRPSTVDGNPPPITDTRAQSAAVPASPARASDVTDERLKAEPVDPWATGEAAALAAGHVAPTSVPPSTPHSPPPHWQQGGSLGGGFAAPGTQPPVPGHDLPPGRGFAAPGTQPPVRGHDVPAGGWVPGATTPAAAPARRGLGKRAYIGMGLILILGLVAGGVALLRPNGKISYQPLSEPRRIAPIVPVSSDWSDAEILDGRAYFASSDSETGSAGVVAIGVGDSKPAWTSTAAGKAARWKSMIALPVGVALFTDVDSTTSKRRVAVLGKKDGALLWERTIGNDDPVLFAGDSAVLADRDGHRLVGLGLSDGRERWSVPDPRSTYAADTHVITVTTPKDLAGPATVFGRPFEPDFADDARIVQIGADKSARVIDADSGKVLTSRQNVAEPDDEVVAHNGRLIVLQPDDQRIVAYDLEKFGEPRVLYTTQEQNSQMKDVTPCGDDRVCFDEEIGYDGKTATVVALDVAKGKQLWRYRLANTETIVPVGEALLVTTTTPDMTLLDADGGKVWTHAGEAARLNDNNLLEFSKQLNRTPGETALYGRRLGAEAVPLGSFADVRSDTCSWDTSMLACVAEKDFVLQRFAH
ncbi:Hsp70 family protein [Actinoplanes sp. CA-030573]|uniref:Hsp70 family protein n=1 Tax=Actinoplanes sp. CA-030573 TaxID=3239898 RepID=UPI003D8C1F1C